MLKRFVTSLQIALTCWCKIRQHAEGSGSGAPWTTEITGGFTWRYAQKL